MMFTKKDALPRLFLCALSFLIGISVAPATLAAATETACSSKQFDEISKIRYIHDGDTLHLIDGRKIRLIGINTPELARDDKPAEPYATEATNALKSLFNNNKSIALLYGEDRKDRYGRFLAHALLPDGQNVQATLLKQGLAQVIAIPPNTKFTSCYLAIEQQARCDKAGLWQSTNIVAAQQLENSHIGFHLVRGKVENIRTNKKSLWLNLDHKLTIGIRPADLALFDIKAINKLLNNTIIVRGWINKSDKTTPFYVRVRHPLSIQSANAYSCH